MTTRKVIVFGATGAVGSAAARTAQELGAKVVLALRDTAKPIPGLDAAREKQGNFERVYADLTKPDSVRDAVKSTQAKQAFFYAAFGVPDSQKSVIEALKSSGVELVVFLSSFTIQGDITAIQPSQLIPYFHAQVELNLEKVLGPDGKYVALRPGSFASNTLRYKEELKKGEVRLFNPDVTVDNIVPEDIGRVAGTILAKGPQDDLKHIYLYGPELLSQTDTVKILAKVLGKNPKIETADKEETLQATLARGVPAPLAKYLVDREEMAAPGGQRQVAGYPVELEQLSNVQKYSGREATTYEEWVQQNKHLFLS